MTCFPESDDGLELGYLRVRAASESRAIEAVSSNNSFKPELNEI